MKKLLSITIVALLSCNVLFAAVDQPGSITASNPTDNTIDLDWTQNSHGNNVLIAQNIDADVPGAPVDKNTYIAGNILPGGGLVIYNGSALLFTDSGLLPNTLYYYKAWSSPRKSF